MKSQPIVSVIIPVYNSEAYLRKSLDCILRQTLHHIELICIDDGSSDASPAILDEYQQKDPRVHVYHTRKGGAGAARNLGMQKATGEYLYFFDSDDQCSRDLLKKTVRAAQRESADIVAFHFECIDHQGNRIFRNGFHKKWLPRKQMTFSYLDCPDRILSIINPTPWNKLYRRDFIAGKNLKFEEISSSNDITFAAVSAACAGKITLVDEALYQYQTGLSGTISSTKSNNLNNTLAAVSSVARQIEALPYADLIRSSLLYFEIDNYVYTMKNYVSDFGAPEFRPFYESVRARFSEDLYLNLSQKVLSNRQLYLAFNIIKNNDYNTLSSNLNRKIIVSLTTYPARISSVHLALNTIYSQTRKPDQVVLWLAEEQFPGKMDDLPQEIVRLSNSGKLKICWCPDLKPHKKYFYALQNYTEDLLVTIDDDLLYHPHLLENLYISYLMYPQAVSAARAHLITGSLQDGILPYDCWIKETDLYIHQPSMQFLCTGGAGTLYPPRLFKQELFDEETIRSTCLYADDLWLKTMELLSGIPVVIAEPYAGIRYIPGTQEEALCKSNINDNQNDIQLSNIISWTDQTYGKNTFLQRLFVSDTNLNLTGMEAICRCYIHERNLSRKTIRSLQSQTSLSSSFKRGPLGIVAWMMHKFRSALLCLREHGLRYTLQRIRIKLLKRFVKSR